jgi:hypothetical protein
VIRFLVIAFAVVALTALGGLYATGPSGVMDPGCSDPTPPADFDPREHCPRPIGMWERISLSAGW